MSKSTVAKKAQKGIDMGKPGKGFSKGVSSMMKKGMSSKSARNIMGAQMNRMRKKGML